MTAKNRTYQNLLRRCWTSENGCTSHLHKVEGRGWLDFEGVLEKTWWGKNGQLNTSHVRSRKFTCHILDVSSETESHTLDAYPWRQTQRKNTLKQQDNTGRKSKVYVCSLFLLFTILLLFAQLTWSTQLSYSLFLSK